MSFKPITKRSNRNHVSPSTVIWKLLYRSKAICNFTKMTRIKTKHITRTIYIIHIRCIFSFLFIGRELTKWPANNCLQVSVLLQIIFCSCVIETTLSCENGGSVPRAGREWFHTFCWSKERWSNDKTIIELGYRKISWFVSVSQIDYLPQSSATGNNWSARHWQITIFCSTSLNNC